LRPWSNLSLEETGRITLLALELCHPRVDAGLRSNEALANRAIQLFGLFRVFGEQLEEFTKGTARKTRGPDLVSLVKT